MNPVLALRQVGGAARWGQLMSLGVTDDALRAAVSRGEVFRPQRGTYSLPGCDAGIVAAASLRGQLACVSACAHWGLDQLSRPDCAHVLVPTDRHPLNKRLARLRLLGVHRDEPWQGDRLIQPADQSVDHTAWCTTPMEQLVILDSALRKGLLDPLYGPTLTKGTVARMQWLLRLAAPLASPAESVAHALLDAAGFSPVPQLAEPGVGHVDFGVGRRHIVEVDGWEFHSSEASFEDDRRRDRELAVQHVFPLRFPAKIVLTNPRGFIFDVARAINKPVDARFDDRLQWMTTLPNSHLNRRKLSRVRP